MNNLKKLRKSKGITQEEMANLFNINRTTYGKWEQGIHAPDADSIIKLADYFDVTTDYLLGKTNSPISPNSNEHLIIPDDLKDVKVAFHKGEDGLTQDEVDKIAEYVRFIRSQRDKK